MKCVFLLFVTFFCLNDSFNMKTPCCVESGNNNCPKTSSCPMILRSSCSHRHSHKSLMVNEVQTQGDTHQKRSSSVKKKFSTKGSDVDSANNNTKLDSFCSSIKQLTLTSSESFSILNENISNCLELSEHHKYELIENNGDDSELIRKLNFSQTSTPFQTVHLNNMSNSKTNSQKSTAKEDCKHTTSSTMSRSRRLQRSNLRAFSGSEGEEESILENKGKTKRTRNSEARSRLNSESVITASNSNTNSHGSSNHKISSHSYYAPSAFNTDGSAPIFSSYQTPTGYIQYQRTVSPDSPDMSSLDMSVVQYSTFDKFRWVLWRYVYLKIITSVNFDAWLLSRAYDKKCKALLILFLPLLLYLCSCTTPYWDLGTISKPFSLISSSVLSFVSSVYSLLSSPYTYSQEKLIEEESSGVSCAGASFLSTISGVLGYLSNFFVKTEESTTFISQKSFKSPDSTSRTVDSKLNRDDLRSMPVEMLDGRINDLINNFYVTKIQYENLKTKEEAVKLERKYQMEISDLHLQFQSLSGLLKQLEKDVYKVEESTASTTAKHIENLSKEHDARFKLLNEKVTAFEAKLESLGAIKKCCDEKMAPADFMASLEKHLVTAFKNVVEGDKNPNSPYYFFNDWLNSKLTDRTKISSEINSAFEKLKMQLKPETRQDKDSLKVIEGIVQHYVESLKTNLTFINSAGSSVDDSLSILNMRKIAKEAIMLYDADKTGLVDYALESAGGSVLGTRCSESYTEKNGKISVFGLPLWSDMNSPRTAIQPNVQPGECWAFKGSQGFLVIQLSYTIYPTGFTLEHIPVSLSPTGSIDSAPKDFSVWGLASESDNEGILLGKYTYDKNREPLQYFSVQNLTSEHISFVELKIHSNQGNLEYTCLYRFRVHGTRV